MQGTLVSSNTRIIKSKGKKKRILVGTLAMDTPRGPSYPSFTCFNGAALKKLEKIKTGSPMSLVGSFKVDSMNVVAATNPKPKPAAFVPTLRTAYEWLEQPYYANVELRNTNGWTFKNGKPLTGKRIRNALGTPMTESVFAYRLQRCEVGIKLRRA